MQASTARLPDAARVTQGDSSGSPAGNAPRILAGHYRMERELGRGGMATVFLCTDLRDDRRVAFKVLNPDLGNTVTRERFLREIKFVSELDHPSIPKVIEAGVIGEDPFYVMTYVTGESLRARLDGERQLPIGEVIRIATGILQPMSYAHERSIVHRDIKPDNILLSDDRVIVLDFGIARAVVASGGDRLTLTGMAVGTPAYMSPEQAVGDRELDLRSDIYSLGCVVYEMIAGVAPFTGASPQILMFRRFSETPRALSETRGDVPEALERAVSKAMAKKAEDRWHTAEAFAEALTAAGVTVPASETIDSAAGDPGQVATTESRRADGLLDQLRSSFAGTYSVEEEMKGGGMSRLFLATDPELGRRVVIKILPPELTSQMMLARFRRESEVTARLQHPHILPVISAGVRDGLAHYVMPFFEGESLRGRLQREGKLSIGDGVRILREVAAALSYAHKQGVVHRDIKPENILIQDGHAVLADFGIAAALGGLGKESGGERLTGTGMSLGTVGYMAPEQALGEKNVDARADIYAVGVVGYEIFAGAPPFTGVNDQAVLVAHLTRDAVRLDDVREDTPAAVSEAIAKAMQKDPDARYQTAAEFRDALEAAGGVTVGRTRVSPLRAIRKLPLKWKAGIPAAALVAAAVIAMAVRYRADSVATEAVTIAIAPFNALGTGLELWREGMVDVMARNLDGAGPLRTVSPTVALKGFTTPATRQSATELARRTNADYAIFGRVVGSSIDSVRLYATLVNVATDVAWDYEGRDANVESAADKFTLAVLAELEKTHRIGALRQSSLGSASVPAIRAFLQGEQFYRRSSWDSASVSYARAIGFDSNFSIALRRAAKVAGWQRNGNDSLSRIFKLRAGRANRGLSPRDSLLVVADSLSASIATQSLDSLNWNDARRLFATVNQAAVRYPNDPDVWYAVGEARFHTGFGSGVAVSERDALHAFDRAIALDSAFSPAYVHAIELGFTLDGVAAGRRYLSAYRALNPTDEDAVGYTILDEVVRAGRLSPAVTDSVLDRALTNAVFAAWYPIRRWPDSAETALRLLQSIARRPRNSPSFASDSGLLQRYLPSSLAYRGRFSEAYLELGNRPSLLFVEMALLGAIPRDTASAVFARWRNEGAPHAYSALRWLADHREIAAIQELASSADSATRSGGTVGQRAARYKGESARAYLSLAKGDTTDALKRFNALPDTLCMRCYLDRLTTAQLLAARGRLQEAAALTRERINSLLTPSEVWIALERGRLAAKLGKRSEAARAFALVVDAWSRGDPSVQPMVASARAGLEAARGATAAAR
ncbi:MAG: serine/threonine-protein kinase [Gemmatimonadaceae bacterium]